MKQISAASSVRREILVGGVVLAAAIIFIDNGSEALSSALSGLHVAGGNDRVLTVTLLLNVALILFGWRRYKDLTKEIADRKTAQQLVQTLAYNDPLTGMLNRRSLGEASASLIAKAVANNQTVAFLMLDLDRFKNVNDTHGHMVGDLLLREIATKITAFAPRSALCARLGGDEFAVLASFGPEAARDIEALAASILRELSRPIFLGGLQANVGCSIGVATLDQSARDFEQLQRRADIAMYRAKHDGGGKMLWFDASMEEQLDLANAIEAGLRAGIPRGEIVPYYEQQIDLSTGKIKGFEMLARWIHPTQGVIGPDVFIPVAEATGLISDLSESVMRQAFLDAKHWDTGISLSVNISPVQLTDSWLAEKIIKLLAETGFPANRLEVEITESSLFENLGLAKAIVTSLKNQGIRLALDDFGTGYSSLAHLRALPFDKIKIDRHFVHAMQGDEESWAIVRAIANLGDSLGVPITAEGIEDVDVQKRLRDIGCDDGQGYLYGQPLSSGDVSALLEEQTEAGRAIAA